MRGVLVLSRSVGSRFLILRRNFSEERGDIQPEVAFYNLSIDKNYFRDGLRVLSVDMYTIGNIVFYRLLFHMLIESFSMVESRIGF